MKEWYTISELKEWLIKQKYSETIASELAPFLHKHYNLALKKGESNLRQKIEGLRRDYEKEKDHFNFQYKQGVEDVFNKIENFQ